MSDGTREKPILFSAPMVRAIRDGRKTQTRRIMKIQPDDDSRVDVGEIGDTRGVAYIRGSRGGQCVRVPCSYGQPGERLWVRETWAWWPADESDKREDGLIYRADDDDLECRMFRWRSPIHMPRWASRITLEITGVRVERLQEINGDNCVAEGIDEPGTYPPESDPDDILRRRYQALWESINGPGSWDLNPYVWVIEFKRV